MNPGNGVARAPSARRFVSLIILLVLLLPVTPVRGATPVDTWGGSLVPLVYHGRPLPEVIEDIQRFARRRIMIDSTVSGYQYSGIVKLEDVDAWIRDLPAIYPVEIIDCRASGARLEMSSCADAHLIVIRSRLDLHQNVLRSALR